MKFTLSWLKDHLDTDASLSKIVDTLNAIGLEVDTVKDPAAELAPFRVAHVVSAEQHPDADRLRVCMVDTGEETVQVVCGAPNARTGMKGVFAPSGSYIPGLDVTLKPSKIRGVESNGMLVSEREMGLSDEHEGIIDLPGDSAVGTPFAQVLGLDDPVIDIELTPNRPDCTGVRGIARDLAAAGLGTLKPLAAAEPVEGSYDSPVKWAIADDGNACPYVVGRHFRGVTNRPSPQWAQDRLRAIGLRPISALVDVTNYVSIDLGRPLHVFDAGKIGDTLTMRRARDGEPFHALVGDEYELESSMTVIGDGDVTTGRAEALAGVMGGMESSCLPETTDVFLEVALFEPVAVAATGRALQIDSDARYRFERGVDPESADWGAEVAARMILEFCGGETSRPVSAGTRPDPARRIALRPDRVQTLGGADIPLAEQTGILERLGFAVDRDGDTVVAVPPSWRPDVHGEADLVEEITRIWGFDRIPAVSLTFDGAVPLPALTPAQRRAGAVRRTLAAQGLDEAVTWSFMPSAQADLFGGVPDSLHLANPISADLDVLRPSILPNLIAALGRNVDRGFADLGLFELGPAYRDDTEDGQLLVAAGARQGNMTPPHWSAPARPADALDAKADAMAALAAANAPVANAQVGRDAPDWYHPGRSGSLRLGRNVLAYFGELHPRVLTEMGVRGPVVAFEVFLDAIPEARARGTGRPALHLSPFQPVRRDFAFLVDDDVAAGDVLRAARGADKTLIADVALFDIYTGKGIEDGKKSLAVEVTLQPVDKTLTDAEIDAVAAQIVAAVAKATGGTLRG
ncbi:unnamed protein product [Discosporangium mesarthrocarpum]